MMADIKFFSLFVIGFLVAGSSGKDFEHRCIHDKIAKMYSPISFQSMSSHSSKHVRDRRQANDYLPYRIDVNFVSENITNASTLVPFLNDSSEGLQLAVNYLQSVLSVVRLPRNIVVPPLCVNRSRDLRCISNPATEAACGPHVRVPDEHLGRWVCDPMCDIENSGEGVDADYILYVTAVQDDNCGNTTLAYASFCAFDEDSDFRPLAGFANICPQNGVLEYSRRGFFLVLLHELLHGIGFHDGLFQIFVDENGERYNAAITQIINGQEVHAINSPKVLSYGRDYYSCPTLQGVLLENEGGDGTANSHWEIRTLDFELMNGIISSSRADYTSISNFTLNLLEDSGWYKVNYAVAESSLYYYEQLYGKGLGCSFITADCDTWPYACSPLKSIGCSYDYQVLSKCIKSVPANLYDGCNYYRPFSDGYCPATFSSNSSCFPLIESGNSTANCYERQCYRYSGLQKPFYTIDIGSTIFCPRDGAKVILSGSTYTCPPANLVCSRNAIISEPPSNVPPSWCDNSCATCLRPASPAHCITCSASLALRDIAPSVCTNDSCTGSTFQDSSGNCVACADGCRACTGPDNSDCLACEDEALYRVTTDQPTSGACLTAAECDNTDISAFGDRTCILNERGGANSAHYSQLLMMFLLVVYSLYL